MGVINTNDLKNGMVLAQNVMNRHGNLLLGKGKALTEKDILTLKTWGITEADAEGIDKDEVEKLEMESVSAAAIESIENELADLFPQLPDNPVMEEIYRITKKLKLKHKQVLKHKGGDGTVQDRKNN